jgi:hypothetical protein
VVEAAMISRLWLIALFLLVLGLPGQAETPPIRKIQILERGVYRAQTIGRINALGTMGFVNAVRNARLISSTTSVMGMIGVRFGLRYVVLSESRGARASLKFVITLPSGGLRNPATGQLFFQSEHSVTVPFGTVRYWEYHFQHQWEIAPGLWRFEIWDGTNKLGEQEFCIYRVADPNASVSREQDCRTDVVS